MDFFSSISNFKQSIQMIISKTFSVNFLLFVDVNFGELHFCEPTNKKYSDMLNMKALVGIRIIFMRKEFE